MQTRRDVQTPGDSADHSSPVPSIVKYLDTWKLYISTVTTYLCFIASLPQSSNVFFTRKKGWGTGSWMSGKLLGWTWQWWHESLGDALKLFVPVFHLCWPLMFYLVRNKGGGHWALRPTCPRGLFPLRFEAFKPTRNLPVTHPTTKQKWVSYPFHRWLGT